MLHIMITAYKESLQQIIIYNYNAIINVQGKFLLQSEY